ncbi:MAG: DNRLRE domain-containing protein [Cyanobacteria bacterium J06621_8]
MFRRHNINQTLQRSLLLILVALFSLFLTLSPALGQESQVLLASKDNTLIESSAGDLSNGMGALFFVGRTKQQTASARRSLIAFNVADVVPSGSTITEVQLILSMERSPGGKEPVKLHQVLSDWGEGDSSFFGGRGAPAAQGDSTWIYAFYDQDLWLEPGGDFAAEASAVELVEDVGSYVWDSESHPQMVKDVQQWLDSPESNFGWLLLGNEADSGTVKAFASRQNDDVSKQPQLKIRFQS